MILPSVNPYSRRHWLAVHPAAATAGEMYRSQMSDSLNAFLFATRSSLPQPQAHVTALARSVG